MLILSYKCLVYNNSNSTQKAVTRLPGSPLYCSNFQRNDKQEVRKLLQSRLTMMHILYTKNSSFKTPWQQWCAICYTSQLVNILSSAIWEKLVKQYPCLIVKLFAVYRNHHYTSFNSTYIA